MPWPGTYPSTGATSLGGGTLDGAIAAFAAEGIVDPKSADPMCASATPSSATLASTTYHKGKELHHSLCYGCLHPFETQSYVANHTCQGTESVKNVLGSDEVC